MRRGAGLLAALLMGGAGLVAQGTLDLVKTITHYANPPGLAAGTPEGSYALSGAENLDYFSGHLSYALPLLKIGGRGEAGYTVTLQIPSRWEASSQVHCNPTENFGEVCTPTRYHAMFGDPNAAAVGYGPGIVMRRSTGTYGPCRDNASNPDQWAYAMKSSRTSFVFVDSNGSQHELFDTSSHGGQLFFPDLEACAKDSVLPNRGKIFASRDGGAMTFVADGNVVDQAYLGTGAGLGGVTGGRLFFPNGTMYRVNADGRVSYMRDRFGNVTSFEYAGNPLVLTKVTDATGREVTFTYSATLDTITFPKYGGGVNTIQIGRDVLENRLRSDFAGGGTGTYHELFNAVNDWCAENQRPRPECLVNPRLPVYVLLPNGRQYAFRYNRHAELAEVTLPTGGRFEYDWAGGEAGTQPDGYLASSTDLALIHRVVKQRRAYTQSAGGTAARVTYFEPGTLVTGASRDVAEAQNAASAPRLESHFYNGSPVTGSFLQPGHEPYWNDGKETRTEIRGNGSLLRTAENEWVQLSNQTPVLKSVTTKLNRASGGALWSKIEHSYDLFANIIETTETDWGAGIVGAVLRKRSTAYVTDPAYTQANETNPANYKAHLRRLPLSETVYKVNGGSQTQEARTEFVYDEPAYPEQECAGLALHDTSLPGAPFDSTQYLIDNPARRNTSFVQFGNVTTVNAWVSGSSYISTHAKYDLAGNAVWSQDGRENETALVYGQGNCSLLSAVSTTVGTQTHTVSMQYDFNTGKMTQHTDPAGVATALVYEAALGRLSQVTNGHGTSFAKTSTIAYNDNANTVTVTAPVAAAPEVSSAINAVTTTSYDGLGRVAETERATGGNPVIVKTAYDALGRVASTSLPSDDGNYRYVTFAYDALGRVTSKSWGDGASEQTEYQVSEIGLAADQTKVMDAANKWRVLATDALGRLIRVREPAGSGSTAVETGYTYNALDNLLSVDEGGRMRSFSYDALGRLLSASNPESGTVNYVYDNNGNLTQKTDARGVVTSYTYDELNRPLAKSYSGGVSTPSAAWVWDTAKVGKLTSVASGISKTSFSYDAAGRIAGSVQRTDNVDYAFEYHYYRGWGLRQVKYPSGRWVRYTPDAAERVAQVEAVDSGGNVLKNYWSGALYAPQGALKQVTLGNALTER
ncbi:MAG: RHS repeat protein, partial [Bryobacterales bacterium]|nr:RHS repeat protein [Bryobacterales bacterium]